MSRLRQKLPQRLPIVVLRAVQHPLQQRPLGQADAGAGQPQRRQVPGSTAFVPAAAGLILAGEVVRDLSAGTAPKP